MSRKGDEMRRRIEDVRKLVPEEPSGAWSIISSLLEVVDDLNYRLQVLERENGHSDAFVDPNDGTHRLR